jgi:GTPase SAR1 family protein
MGTIQTLLDIARYLGLNNIEKNILSIQSRLEQNDANIILPFVGEFSSGKTTLINSLTDSKQLETATKPTTATIYEIHFGSDTCKATILNENNEFIEVDDISQLKNEQLADAKVVTVFDTSTRVPSSTILVDTPGLSSPDPKHKQTLIDFLPLADGILLVTDINQQITRSLTDFIDTMKLSKKPIYLILTKSDTKSSQEIIDAKKYISENCKVPISQVAVVSAPTGKLDELYALFETIQKSKKEILQKVDGQRIKNIISILAKHIDELMKVSSSDEELEKAIRQQQYELDKINRNIDQLIESVSDDIVDAQRTVSRKFEDNIFAKLNTLVTGKSNNYDNDAINTINSTASLLINDYKNNISGILREKAKNLKGSDGEVPLESLTDYNMSDVQISGLSYNLDLNTMGHEYDGMIKVGVIATAAVAAAAVAVAAAGAVTASTAIGTATAGTATAETAAGALTTAAAVNEVVDVADTVSDIGSIISNQKAVSRMEKAVNIAAKAKENFNSINTSNDKFGQQNGNNKGMIDSMIGFVTDNMMSKPQRVRAIRNYLDSSLVPELKNKLDDISQQIISNIRTNLNNEASQMIENKTKELNKLKQELKGHKNTFNEKIEQLRDYKNKLLTL